MQAKAQAEEKLETMRWNLVSEYYHDVESIKVSGAKLRTAWYELKGEAEPEAHLESDDEDDEDE